jgi:hypothetical protein
LFQENSAFFEKKAFFSRLNKILYTKKPCPYLQHHVQYQDIRVRFHDERKSQYSP